MYVCVYVCTHTFSRAHTPSFPGICFRCKWQRAWLHIHGTIPPAGLVKSGQSWHKYLFLEQYSRVHLQRGCMCMFVWDLVSCVCMYVCVCVVAPSRRSHAQLSGSLFNHAKRWSKLALFYGQCCVRKHLYRLFASLCMHVCTYINTYVCMCVVVTRTEASTAYLHHCVCMCACMCVYICVYICVYMHTYVALPLPS
jgi:hypothetical protein